VVGHPLPCRCGDGHHVCELALAGGKTVSGIISPYFCAVPSIFSPPEIIPDTISLSHFTGHDKSFAPRKLVPFF
jgi:hypothetical protein